jgi:hypothetical protein
MYQCVALKVLNFPELNRFKIRKYKKIITALPKSLNIKARGKIIESSYLSMPTEELALVTGAQEISRIHDRSNLRATAAFSKLV